MNRSIIARTIVGGIVGGIAGRLVHSLVEDSINTRKRVATLSAKLQADMDDFRNQMRTAGILAQAEANEEYRTMRRVDGRLAGYTEAELFWILDRHDDKVADLDADVQMAEADAADAADAADENGWAGAILDDAFGKRKPGWANDMLDDAFGKK